MTKSTGKNAPRHRWTSAEEEILRRRFPHERTSDIAAELGVRVASTYTKARKLGIQKTPEYLASPAACRLRRGDSVGAAFRFPQGHVPANKGLRRPGYAPGRMRETQFKKGQFPPNRDPDFYVIGALRVNADGYVDMRTSFDLGAKGWKALHRILWEDAHGPVPKGHVVVFKNGDKLDVCIENLELLSLVENMRRNTLHRYPKPIAQAIQLRGALIRKINRRERNAQADR